MTADCWTWSSPRPCEWTRSTAPGTV